MPHARLGSREGAKFPPHKGIAPTPKGRRRVAAREGKGGSLIVNFRPGMAAGGPGIRPRAYKRLPILPLPSISGGRRAFLIGWRSPPLLLLGRPRMGKLVLVPFISLRGRKGPAFSPSNMHAQPGQKARGWKKSLRSASPAYRDDQKAFLTKGMESWLLTA